ncbi:MAG: tetratricopeptide repeat protein [Duncaniella sp.]|nr:tetratricopeptide repeat protein [Duncaniella sp.]
MRTLSPIILILLAILTGCTHGSSDSRLLQINELSYTSPGEALDSLKAIDPDELTEHDRHFYDFLSVKVPDKAYVPHTSDSLILRVIDYESRHKNLGRYPEALYYGGRVYSDLGDYPTALRSFQDAMDLIPKGDPDLNLRANIVSQYAVLLTKLRLYDEAIPFVSESIEIDRLLNDSVNEVYDLHLLGYILMTKEDYIRADSIFTLALNKSLTLSPARKAKSSMYKAAVKLYIGQLDSARLYINGTANSVVPMARNSALAYSARIYLASEIYDSAYTCASELIHSNDFTNKRIGYQIILDPKLIKRLHPDTIRLYYNDYLKILNNFLNENDVRLAVDQHSLYNYNIHKREREKSEKRNQFLIYSIVGSALVITCLVCIVLLLKYRNKKNILQLRDAIENINRLERSLYAKDSAQNIDTEYFGVEGNSIANLREKLRNKLYQLYTTCSKSTFPSLAILNSEPYAKLQNYINSNKSLSENDPIWDKLEEVILTESPKFKTNLRLLVGGRLTMNDLQTSILIKCGVTPTQMSQLFNRSKGAIVSRRESLGLRVFDQKTATKVIDGIIRLL